MSTHFADHGRPQSLFASVAAAEPEVAERLAERQAEIAQGASTSSFVAAGLALATAPIALAALASDAYGQARLPAAVVAGLNFALVLEYLESEFYTTAVKTSGLIPGSDQTIFNTIQSDEANHVSFLQKALGAQARPKPTFDFTAKGAFPGTVFANYDTFKAAAQAFEDTGVRAYKGQAPALIPYPDILTAALSIHSVEARHASIVRRLRGNFSEAAPNKGWITGNQTDIAFAKANYAGEDNLIQGGIDVSTLVPGVGAAAASEAFDEPLTMAQVIPLVAPFIA
jgi:hypothetical protein